MSYHQYPSKLLESAVREFAKLPGIGRKTALRLVLYLLKQPTEEVDFFGNAITQLKKEIKHCKICKNLSDSEICHICADLSRDKNTICVVENIRDVLSIENTNAYQGVYHVLGGIISPMDGIGPGDLFTGELEERVRNDKPEEVILALSTTMEGDTTNYYIYRKLSHYPVRITTIARGVSIGDDLEYADEVTLGRSIIDRTLFESSLSERKQDR